MFLREIQRVWAHPQNSPTFWTVLSKGKFTDTDSLHRSTIHLCRILPHLQNSIVCDSNKRHHWLILKSNVCDWLFNSGHFLWRWINSIEEKANPFVLIMSSEIQKEKSLTPLWMESSIPLFLTIGIRQLDKQVHTPRAQVLHFNS